MLASVAPRANQDSTDRLGHTFDGSCGSEQRVHAVEKRSPTRREPSRGGLRPQYLVQPTFEPARLPRPNDCMVPVSVNTAATRYRLQSLHSCRPMPVGQVKTGCGRSFREGEWRWPPGPAVHLCRAVWPQCPGSCRTPCCRCRRTTCRPSQRLCQLSAAALWRYRPRGAFRLLPGATPKPTLAAFEP